nr:MAG TPA: RNA polymerase Rpb2-like protein [Caudoviricetes sp.]
MACNEALCNGRGRAGGAFRMGEMERGAISGAGFNFPHSERKL